MDAPASVKVVIFGVNPDDQAHHSLCLPHSCLPTYSCLQCNNIGSVSVFNKSKLDVGPLQADGALGW